MASKISFDQSKDHSSGLQLANNIKLAYALLSSTDLKLEEDKETFSPQLTVESKGYRLFDANAILRYVLNDFEDEESNEYSFAVSSLEPLVSQKDAALLKEHAADAVSKSLQNYLVSLDTPLSATRIIMFANTYALDGAAVEKKFSALPEKLLEALEFAKTKAVRSSADFKHTGAVNVSDQFLLKPQDAEILPKEGERNILITSALPYVNNVPHLGNIVGSVLSADIYSRFAKGRNYNTLFVCGTDEYGTATETKALEDGVTPQELCDKYHKIHSDVYKWFQIGFDFFGRTTTKKQTEIAQDIFLKLNKNKYLEEQSMMQLYCPVHKGFLADRFVEGTCPKCGYPDARGDQCDRCGALLNPFELINPRCKLDGGIPIPRTSEHIFLSLDKLEPSIKKWVEEASTNGKWSKNSKTITQSWLKEGLHPRCITRDLVWGTPVPLEKYKEKVLYVWFDACIGYVSITANYTDKWEQWWKNPENVDLYQFMGKDNVPFHTVIFPGSQLGTGENWTMLHHLNTTEYLQYEGGKFSKSRSIGVFGNNAQEIGLSPSVWRYYLASVRPETSDSQFSWTDFAARNNSELLANLGNFVNRVVKFVNAKYNGVVPEYNLDALPGYAQLHSDLDDILANYVNTMEQVQLRRGLEIAMTLSARGNQFLQDNKLDNSLFAQQPAKSDAVVAIALNIIYCVASILNPFIPETSAGIYRMLNVPPLRIDDRFNLPIRAGHNINKAEYLFSRIDEKDVEKWRNKYAGKQV